MLNPEQPERDPLEAAPPASAGLLATVVFAVRLYAARGLQPLPVRPAEKRPCIEYKALRDAGTLPTDAEIDEVWGGEEEFGVALSLGGPGLLGVVDVDSSDAARALRDRLPDLPTTWTANSGSDDPHRRHHYFALPAGLTTAASITPWHPQLEFRGTGGTIVAPPSLHASGRRYRWRDGLSPLDVPLAPLPGAIAAEFRAHAERKAAGASRPVGARPSGAAPPTAMTAVYRLRVRALPGVGFTTKRFLLGEFSEGPRWNQRLFNAACDLEANGYADAWGEAALLLGAAPWDAAEEAKALASVESAFSQRRRPAVAGPALADRISRRR